MKWKHRLEGAREGRLARCYVDLGKREGVAIFLCRDWFLIVFFSLTSSQMLTTSRCPNLGLVVDIILPLYPSFASRRSALLPCLFSRLYGFCPGYS